MNVSKLNATYTRIIEKDFRIIKNKLLRFTKMYERRKIRT